jgi:hypothetical protein
MPGEPPADAGPTWTEGLPSGRIWNGSSVEIMFKDEKPDEVIRDELLILSFPQHQTKYPGLDAFEVSVSLLRHDTWVLRWFSHYTIDHGQTNQEALKSFRLFVCRTEDLIRAGGTQCLMGAEDSWRWKGKEGLPAPCRCEAARSVASSRSNTDASTTSVTMPGIGQCPTPGIPTRGPPMVVGPRLMDSGPGGGGVPCCLA